MRAAAVCFSTRQISFCVALLMLPFAAGADLQDLISALRAKDYQQALILAKELIAQNPSDPRPRTLEGMAYEGLDNTAEALRDYRLALKQKADYIPALKAEAQLEYANADSGVEKTLRQILKLEPADQVSHAMLAALAYKGGDCVAAIAQYEQSHDAIRDKPDALTQYGDCLFRAHRPDDAISPLRETVSLEPEQWWSRYNLALVEMFRKRPIEVVRLLEPVLAGARVPPQVLDLAAEAYDASGDTPRAVKFLREAIVDKPKNETYYLHFADLCFDHQSFRVGVDMVDAGLKQLPRSARLYLARGVLLIQLGDFAKAEQDFDRADELDGSKAISGAAASLAELESSNLEKALNVARTKLKSRPEDATLCYVKAEILRQMGAGTDTKEFREALASASAAVRLRPDYVLARNLLGSLYLQENNPDLAGQQFRAVLKEDPMNQTAIYRLMQLCRKTGRTKDIPGLVKQLAQARIEQRQKDEAAGKYRLIEAKETPSMPSR